MCLAYYTGKMDDESSGSEIIKVPLGGKRTRLPFSLDGWLNMNLFARSGAEKIPWQYVSFSSLRGEKLCSHELIY